MTGSHTQLSPFEGGNEMKELRFFQVANSHLMAYFQVESQNLGWAPSSWRVEGKGNLRVLLPHPLTILLSHPFQKQVIFNTDALALQFSSFVQDFLFP